MFMEVFKRVLDILFLQFVSNMLIAGYPHW
jgi:hypothetical protein